MKICSKCKENKCESEFRLSKRSPDGLHWQCRSCCKAYNKEYHERPEAKAKRRTLEALAKASAYMRLPHVREKNRRRSKTIESRVKSWRRNGIDVTTESWNQMYTSQRGVCAICGSSDRRGFRLSLDHDHRTMKVRGLLCTSCNNGIGRFGDNSDLLRKAADYLDNVRTPSGVPAKG